MFQIGAKKSGAHRTGRQESSEERIQIKALWTDFHSTWVTPVQHLTKAKIVVQVAEKVLKRTIDEKPETVYRRVLRVRLKLAKILSRREQGSPVGWILANMVVFNCNHVQAMEMSNLFVRAIETFRMTRTRRRFFEWLFAYFQHLQKGKVLTASNSNRKTIQGFMQKPGQRGLSKRLRIVTGEQLGCYKPSPEFFIKLRRLTDVPEKNILFIGNSLFNDLAAARWREEGRSAGVHVLLILERGLPLNRRQIEKRFGLNRSVGKVFIVRNLAEARQVISAQFVGVRG